jgi:hypothetical protein
MAICQYFSVCKVERDLYKAIYKMCHYKVADIFKNIGEEQASACLVMLGITILPEDRPDTIQQLF